MDITLPAPVTSLFVGDTVLAVSDTRMSPDEAYYHQGTITDIDGMYVTVGYGGSFFVNGWKWYDGSAPFDPAASLGERVDFHDIKAGDTLVQVTRRGEGITELTKLTMVEVADGLVASPRMSRIVNVPAHEFYRAD